jgi:hypothetical protein
MHSISGRSLVDWGYTESLRKFWRSRCAIREYLEQFQICNKIWIFTKQIVLVNDTKIKDIR